MTGEGNKKRRMKNTERDISEEEMKRREKVFVTEKQRKGFLLAIPSQLQSLYS